MIDAQVTYTPRPDTTPEAELSALASVYGFVLQKRQEREKAVCGDRPEQPERIKDDPAKTIIPE